MVVDQDRRVSRMHDGGPENLARVRDTFIQRAERNILHAASSRNFVSSKSTLKDFAVASLKLGAKGLVDNLGTVQHRSLGFSPGQTLAKFECGGEFGCLWPVRCPAPLWQARRLMIARAHEAIPFSSEARWRA